MKKNILKIPALLLLFAVGLAASCHKEQYPIDISFTEYLLAETACQWTNLPYDNKVIIINSDNELKKYLEGDYPAIDFSKYTLLLANGYVNNRVSEIIVKNVRQVSIHTCILNLELGLKYKDSTEPWHIALRIEKLSEENVKLNTTLKAPKIIRPIPITDGNIINFFNMTLDMHFESDCFFTDIDRYADTCFLINNIFEFQQACVCTDDLPEIDFDKFTLIIGKKYYGWSAMWFVDQKIIEDSALTLVVQKYYSPNGFDGAPAKNHWGIYPKLPNKPFYVEYKYEDE